ncbi:MAG: hypothetical protein ACLTN0_05995 [Coprococcus phoceensis]
MNETAVAENNVYYVSSDGNDENSGMSAEELLRRWIKLISWNCARRSGFAGTWIGV